MLEQLTRVTEQAASSGLNLGSQEFRRLAKTAGEDAEKLAVQLVSTLKESERLVGGLLGRS
jgi:hypothetical protein